ncbi:pentapeptide repeat-containing protein [bacterium]|nr:pentapeptide repeat-containing protein [bacterium]
MAHFGYAKFSGGVDFRHAEFSGIADFIFAKFSGVAHFWSAIFSGVAEFGEAKFSGEAHFDYAKFSGGASFWNALFTKEANFFYSTIEVFGLRGCVYEKIYIDPPKSIKDYNFDEPAFYRFIKNQKDLGLPSEQVRPILLKAESARVLSLVATAKSRANLACNGTWALCAVKRCLNV